MLSHGTASLLIAVSVSTANADPEINWDIVDYAICVDGWVTVGAIDFFKQNGALANPKSLVDAAEETICRVKKQTAVMSFLKSEQTSEEISLQNEIEDQLDAVLHPMFLETARKTNEELSK